MLNMFGMRKLLYLACSTCIVSLFVTGCRPTPPAPTGVETDSDSIVYVPQETETDSTMYGVCGEGTAMHTIELITDAGDTLFFGMRIEEDADVQGGLMVGDRLAIMGHDSEHGLVATQVINLTTLLGKWTSLDKNFEILEGGIVQSSVQAESNPWTSWKLLNGRLVLNADTFKVACLGADSLYLENEKGIFVYKRQ